MGNFIPGYDDNGSLTEKITAIKDEPDPQTYFEEKVTSTYNLQNRLAQIVRQYDDANDTIEEFTEYTYNDDGIRVSKHTWSEINDTHQNDDVTVVYLVDSYNHTGYAQVLEEMTFNKADPDPLTETPDSLTTYVIGDDVIAQTTDGTTDYLLYDGHGSTRQLAEYDTDVTIVDSFSYDGYGVLLQDNAVASSNPGKVGTQATNLLYAGEQFDTDAQQYYLRARYYDPLNGRFNRMDPYSGNTQDPQSLHKYLYVHNNPVNNIDPSGLMTTAMSLNIGMAIGALIMGIIAIDMIGYLQGRASITGAYMEIMQLALDYAVDGLTGVAAAIRAHSKAVQKAIEKAIDAAKSVGRAAKKLLKLKKFIFFKFMMPNIFNFNMRALSSNPTWFVLNYLANPIRARANRRIVTSTYGHLRRPGYGSIDEFPYASTRQGGFGALGEAVPSHENLIQGGYLGAFYRWSLKTTPQPFLVVPVPI